MEMMICSHQLLCAEQAAPWAQCISAATSYTAIGDISSNWLNNRNEAERNGIVFTRPIYISTMKVLLTKTLYEDLLERKRQLCLKNLKIIQQQIMSKNDSSIKEINQIHKAKYATAVRDELMGNGRQT